MRRGFLKASRVLVEHREVREPELCLTGVSLNKRGKISVAVQIPHKPVDRKRPRLVPPERELFEKTSASVKPGVVGICAEGVVQTPVGRMSPYPYQLVKRKSEDRAFQQSREIDVPRRVIDDVQKAQDEQYLRVLEQVALGTVEERYAVAFENCREHVRLCARAPHEDCYVAVGYGRAVVLFRAPDETLYLACHVFGFSFGDVLVLVLRFGAYQGYFHRLPRLIALFGVNKVVVGVVRERACSVREEARGDKVREAYHRLVTAEIVREKDCPSILRALRGSRKSRTVTLEYGRVSAAERVYRLLDVSDHEAVVSRYRTENRVLKGVHVLILVDVYLVVAPGDRQRGDGRLSVFYQEL